MCIRDRTKTGGILSIGPPDGLPLLAHPKITKAEVTIQIKFLMIRIQIQIKVFKIVKRTIFAIYSWIKTL